MDLGWCTSVDDFVSQCLTGTKSSNRLHKEKIIGSLLSDSSKRSGGNKIIRYENDHCNNVSEETDFDTFTNNANSWKCTASNSRSSLIRRGNDEITNYKLKRDVADSSHEGDKSICKKDDGIKKFDTFQNENIRKRKFEDDVSYHKADEIKKNKMFRVGNKHFENKYENKDSKPSEYNKRNKTNKKVSCDNVELPSKVDLSNKCAVTDNAVGDKRNQGKKKKKNRLINCSDQNSVLKGISEALYNFSNTEKKTLTNKIQIQNIPKILIDKWQSHHYKNGHELIETFEKYVQIDPDKVQDCEEVKWTVCAPSHYKLRSDDSNICDATEKCKQICENFEELVSDIYLVRCSKQKSQQQPKKCRFLLSHTAGNTDSESESDSNASDGRIQEQYCIMKELQRKQQHPDRLHHEIWFNEPGELNDGPVCRCKEKSRKVGIRHNIYKGEVRIPKCDPYSNNADKLFHYRIVITPPTNFYGKIPTVINFNDEVYTFEGFSLFSHHEIPRLPPSRIIRFNINYSVFCAKDNVPRNFVIYELDLFYQYFFKEILELTDFDIFPPGQTKEDSCPIYHFMPRFIRRFSDEGGELLPMCELVKHILFSFEPLVFKSNLHEIAEMDDLTWQDKIQDVKGMIVIKPGSKPSSIRIDQLDKDYSDHPDNMYPDIIHFGVRPPQLSYAGNKKYQKLWRSYIKYRHLLSNIPKPSLDEKMKLQYKERAISKIKTESKLKRGVTVVISSKGFFKTGLKSDIVQHALILPVIVSHLRFHRSLNCLEGQIDYKFKNRQLLQMALTHPSYRENFGTNPDHIRNSLSNCGMRQPEYGDRRIHYLSARKRGINTLINIMSKFGKNCEIPSSITHNERLEFLGDAVLELITSVHLYFLFPDIEEGGLATYRAAIVQNQHLTVLARILNLEDYMLFAHGSDLCHEAELRHALANCFEAVLAALYLDGGLEVADRVFSKVFFFDKPNLLPIWVNYPKHPLQEQEPSGDRKWIEKIPFLQKLIKLEETMGIEFMHIRLLARAFTDSSIGYTNLTFGSNQRLEFLGDTVLQLICSSYLYKHFPDHHEGHLSLLRSSLVNNKTQSIICNDLGLAEYALYASPKNLYKVKDRADILEAFIGALYIDKGMKYCEAFCETCFFPRLQEFIVNQYWNDPKSKLQQCCLTLRNMEGHDPDIPIYKVIECKGPTNGRVYKVAVYFKGQRLAAANGHNIQQAEMNAARQALVISQGLFPQLNRRRRECGKVGSSVGLKSKNHLTKNAPLRSATDKQEKTEQPGNSEADDFKYKKGTLGELIYMKRKMEKMKQNVDGVNNLTQN